MSALQAFLVSKNYERDQALLSCIPFTINTYKLPAQVLIIKGLQKP